MEYEVYRHNDATNEEFEYIDAWFKRVLSEDKYLCDNVQKNLNAGVFVNGELHPELESAPLYFQKTVRQLLMDHRRAEKEAGRELWPSSRSLRRSGHTKELDEFCSGLACTMSQDRDVVEW
jgi:hypothetical protein